MRWPRFAADTPEARHRQKAFGLVFRNLVGVDENGVATKRPAPPQPLHVAPARCAWSTPWCTSGCSPPISTRGRGSSASLTRPS